VITVTKQKILVVDDDQAVLRLVKLILCRAGYQVITVTTGEEGVQRVSTEKPDLVLMDVMMPGIDGFEATRHIRRLPEGRHIPIIFLSALDQTEAKIKGLRIGGQDYIIKPVKAGELLARIEVHLRSEAFSMGRLITTLGSKPGVGVTTLMVNLALALRNVSRKSVLLVDWRRPLGDVALFLGLPKKRILEFLLSQAIGLDEKMFNIVMKEYAPGVWVLPGATEPASAEKMTQKVLSKVLEMALIRADYIFVDGGPFFAWNGPPMVVEEEGIHLDVSRPELTLCVLTPELVSVERAADAVETVEATNDDFWLLLNRDGMPGGISRKQIESRLGTPLKGYIPEESDQVARALNEGHPLYIADPDSRFSRAIDDVATRMHEALTL
jgi:CheY-like chemotaxis protein/MinD-like ATPase involved in chromosome partitioning or flagellar assembly